MHVSTRLEERNTMVFLVFAIFDGKEVKRDKHFLKNGHLLFKAHRTLIIYYFHFKSQHAAVRAIYGRSRAVSGNALAVIVFEMLSIFFRYRFVWQNNRFF